MTDTVDVLLAFRLHIHLMVFLSSTGHLGFDAVGTIDVIDVHYRWNDNDSLLCSCSWRIVTSSIVTEYQR